MAKDHFAGYSFPAGVVRSVTDSISSTTTGTAIRAQKDLWLSLDFTTGTFVGSVTLKCSRDGGTTYKTVTDAQGNAATWTADLETAWPVPVEDWLYRWDATRSSGTLAASIYQ